MIKIISSEPDKSTNFALESKPDGLKSYFIMGKHSSKSKLIDLQMDLNSTNSKINIHLNFTLKCKITGILYLYFQFSMFTAFTVISDNTVRYLNVRSFAFTFLQQKKK